MVFLKKITGLLIFLSATLLLSGACPENLPVKPVLENGGIADLRKLAVQLTACPDRTDSLAVVYHKLGVKYYVNNDYDSAIVFAEKTLRIREKLFQKNPTIDLAKSYRNLGTFYSETGQTALANKRLKKGIEIFKELNPTDKIKNYIIESYLSLVRNYRNEGEYQLAKDYLNLIFAEIEETKNPIQKADALLEKGSVLSEQGEYKKAIAFLEESNEIYIEQYSIGSEICYNNLGKSQYYLKAYSKSIENYSNAIEIIQEYGISSDLAIAYNNLGMSYLKNGENKKAFLTLRKGLQNGVESSSAPAIAQSHNHFAEYYRTTNDYQNALISAQHALKALIPFFDPENDEVNPQPDELVNAEDKIGLLIYLSDKARILGSLPDQPKGQSEGQSEGRPYLSKALELFELGDALVDQIRKEHINETTKLFWRKKVLPFYEDAIEICYQLNHAEKAFLFFEKSKAILLLDAIQEAAALDTVPDSVRNKIFLLKKNLLETRGKLNLLSENEAGNEKTNLLERVVKAQKIFDDYIGNLEENYPTNLETKVISFSKFKNEYMKDSASCAVHFFNGKNKIYALVTSQNNSQVIELGETENIESHIRKFLGFFENSSMIENSPNDFLSQSHILFELLIAPLSLSNAKELIIFPDGALAYLPFETLVQKTSSDISEAPYLIKDKTIRYGYSATIVSKQNEQKSLSLKKEIAAFAPFANSSPNSNYPALDFSEDELRKISETTRGSFFKNEKATKYSFLNLKDKFSVLHLSTHAFSSSEESRPKIIFSDTVLYLSELYTLDIPANLVVLSACQTNIGKLSPGEGVMSLGRGFTYAGAKSLISSLWNVNAVSTSKILSRFYENLQVGMDKHEALHLAKKSYLEDEAIPSYERSPYYWAGLVYYGDENQMKLDEKSSTWWYYMVTGVLLLLAILLYSKLSNNR